MLAGMVGTLIGVTVFNGLRSLGQLDLIIGVSYVTFLGTIGGLMLTESVRAILNARRGRPAPLRKPGQHNWIHGLPLKMRFKRSKLYVSAIPVVALGIGIGFLGALLGIGGGFILVPALIYLLRVPTNVVIGTSLVQIVATMSVATILHAAHQLLGRYRARHHPDGRRRDRRPVRRPGRPEHPRRPAPGAARRSWCWPSRSASCSAW